MATLLDDEIYDLANLAQQSKIYDLINLAKQFNLAT